MLFVFVFAGIICTFNRQVTGNNNKTEIENEKSGQGRRDNEVIRFSGKQEKPDGINKRVPEKRGESLVFRQVSPAKKDDERKEKPERKTFEFTLR